MNFNVAARPDAAAWDEFVSSRQAGHFMQSSAWGDFQRELGWETHFCTLRDDSGMRAAALLLSRKVPVVGVRVFSAPRGPAVDLEDTEAARALVDRLRNYVRSQGGALLRFDPYWTADEVAAHPTVVEGLRRVPRDWSSWNAPRFVLWLDLSGDENAVMARASSRCRNDIRRGYKNNVVFTLGHDDDLEDFYRMMVMTGHQKGIAFHDVDYYRKLYARDQSAMKVQLFVGRLDGEVITTGMSVAYGRKAWLLYAASAPAHYKLRANRTLQWEMIKWAHSLGCERYDFRGTATNDPPSQQDPGWGVYEFKKSFGPEFTRLAGYYDLVRRPLLYRMFRGAEEYLLPVAYRARTWAQERKFAGGRANGAEVPAELDA